MIRRIQYKGNKSVSESDILDRYKMAKVGLTIESEFDPTVITKAAVTLKELLAEHGRQFASVKPTYERLPVTGAVALTFNLDEGRKVIVGQIIIEGNTAFSARRIIRSMRHSRAGPFPLGRSARSRYCQKPTIVGNWTKTWNWASASYTGTMAISG